MRNTPKLLLFILAIATTQVLFAGAVQRPFSFGISVAHDTVKVGSPILVKIWQKNISDHDITWMFTPGGDLHGEIIGFRPIVRDAVGNEPPLTRWGRVASGRVIPEDRSPGLVLNATGSIAVHPGVVMRTEIKLNELYDLSPGKYTVQVWTYDDENNEKVKSNTITLTVVP